MSLLLALVLGQISEVKPIPLTTAWTPMFNGKDLAGWRPKIKGYEFGENFGNTFRVVDGVIQVNYDGYGGKFDGRFGHLFYKAPYSGYAMKFEYRFTGEQLADGPGWAWRNSGVMLHCQDPLSMTKDQDFPVSAELQLLGGPKEGERHTGNLCTPGTNVVINGKLVTQHTNDSNSPTFRGDDWVSCEARLFEDGRFEHYIDGKKVFEYRDIQLDPNDADAKKLIKGTDLLIKRGWISLQSESHPCEFRNIMIRKLD